MKLKPGLVGITKCFAIYISKTIKPVYLGCPTTPVNYFLRFHFLQSCHGILFP